MNAFRALCLTVGLAALAMAGQAQTPEPEAASPPPEPPEAEAPEPEDASDDVFIPSEEIQADEEVTFPVDI